MRHHVERKHVAAIIAAAFPDYRGKRVTVETVPSVTFQNLNWSNGTRSRYRSCTLDGRPVGSADRFNAQAPWANEGEGKSVPTVPGVLIVEHAQFGQYDSLHIYANAADMPALLPAPVALTEAERFALYAAASFKASYSGRSRYQIATDEARAQGKVWATLADYEDAKRALATRGLMTAAGAITAAGRNALGST